MFLDGQSKATSQLNQERLVRRSAHHGGRLVLGDDQSLRCTARALSPQAPPHQPSCLVGVEAVQDQRVALATGSLCSRPSGAKRLRHPSP
jgi:hypothetical protein